MATINTGARRGPTLPAARAAARERALTGAVLLGLGLGRLIGRVALHQIMQSHHMGSAVEPPTTTETMATNMRRDGFFHLATLALTPAGVLALDGEDRRGTALCTTRVLPVQMIVS